MTTVNVSNISPETTEDELSNFFSFCGKITSLSYTRDAKSASITFERDSAARTALLLDGTPLNETALSVSSVSPPSEPLPAAPAPSPDLRQEDKPISAVFAEYLASGYKIGDAALQKAIELDHKHHLASKFATYLNNILSTLDSKTGASERAKEADQTFHLTEKAHELARYFEKALESPVGQKVRAFYQSGEKQVMDIHNEAKRLAGLKKEFGGSADGKPFVAPDKSQCGCQPGQCTCAGCEKAGAKEAEEKAGAAGQVEHAFQDVKGLSRMLRRLFNWGRESWGFGFLLFWFIAGCYDAYFYF
ncbi:hypothetical protein BDD12DRAFT_776403 [Trichophaea hybrida]|nr:hypothetical protein BDD12DRAFT_776403 [Trichophaea hybrida]